MTTAQAIAIAAAAAVMAWPKAAAAAGAVSAVARAWFSSKVEPEADKPPSYVQAIDGIAVIRSRLKATGNLKDEQIKAINTLSLAVVAGSDQ